MRRVHACQGMKGPCFATVRLKKSIITPILLTNNMKVHVNYSQTSTIFTHNYVSRMVMEKMSKRQQPHPDESCQLKAIHGHSVKL